jgi:hypothetical protein
VTPTITITATPSITVTPTVTPTITPTVTVTPTISETPTVTPTVTVSITPTASPTCFSEAFQRTDSTNPNGTNAIKVFYHDCSNASTTTTLGGSWSSSCITHNTSAVTAKWADNSFPDPAQGTDYIIYPDCINYPPPTPSITPTVSPTPSLPTATYSFTGCGVSNVSKNDACDESINNPVTLYATVPNPTNGDYIYSSSTTILTGYDYVAIQGTGRAINSGTGQLYSSGLDILC